ncbi:MAG: FtsW/RodA/SpoVE family cell cycle protein [Limosilactobacillus gorillae]|jgi:cell division protein FtsW|uniref:FtsW/RodA/SpoVE family cell cycle protein n=1 Tax=Limosilactobacillus gorillae TaxID=1450649 RepID=UPI000B82EBFE|nr:FtsW/RodA/SpoVE family cell cycle protein [Limosilactobacillus gorillae]MDO4855846.1 FtsW/RodA/SpoVE family cell cycle protein [Limosilactobacillus gorillae]
MKNLTKHRLAEWDPWLIVPMVILCVLGIIMVYSASAVAQYQSASGPTAYLVRQSIFVVIGLGVCYFIASVNIEKCRNQYVLSGFGLLVLVALVFVKVAGKAVNGAQGWIVLGPISIQPAEVCKLFLIMFLANFFDNYLRYPKMFQGSIKWFPGTIVMLMFLLILVQPDLGGAAINLAIAGVIFLSARVPWRRAVTILTGVVLVAIFGMPWLSQLALKVIHGYKAARFIGYLNPFGSASGAGSQLVNSYYAISNGGLFGKGLGNSIQKMGYLPEPNTDFILAVIAEELGLIAVILILTGLAIIVCRCVQTGARATTPYDTMVCYGTATFILVEASFNIGAVCGVMPITGVTLPFISYGGSSMVVLCAALGLVLNVSRRQRRQRMMAKQKKAVTENG